MPKKPFTRTYTSAVTLTEDTWKYGSRAQKEDLLEALGHDTSFAETKSMRELVRRGGGAAARDLLNLQRLFLKREGGKITITWK